MRPLFVSSALDVRIAASVLAGVLVCDRSSRVLARNDSVGCSGGGRNRSARENCEGSAKVVADSLGVELMGVPAASSSEKLSAVRTSICAGSGGPSKLTVSGMVAMDSPGAGPLCGGSISVVADSLGVEVMGVLPASSSE